MASKRKKPRSAKQKAATRKLVAFNKRKRSPPRRKTPKRKAAKRKVNKPKTKSKTMVKKSLTSRIPLVNNPTVKKVAAGIGLATIGVAVINIVAPQIAQNPIVKPALAFLGGGVPGLIGQVVVDGSFGIRNILGGNGNAGQSRSMSVAGNGFA